MSSCHILVKGLVCIFWSVEGTHFAVTVCQFVRPPKSSSPYVFAQNSSIFFSPLPLILSLLLTGPFTVPRVVLAHSEAGPQPAPSPVWNTLLLVSALDPGGGATGLRLWRMAKYQQVKKGQAG